MKIDDIELIRLLPKFIRSDPSDIGIAKAIDYLVQSAFTDVKTLRVWDQFESLNEKQCDELAWELDVDWYDSARMTLDEKRETLKYASSIKRKRGTKWSVEQLITSNFDEGYVMEWTDFNGQPYSFIALTTNTNITKENLDRFVAAVEKAKNIRSKMIGVMFLLDQTEGIWYNVLPKEISERYGFKTCGTIYKTATKGMLNEDGAEVSFDHEMTGYKFDVAGASAAGVLHKKAVIGSIDGISVPCGPAQKSVGYGFNKSGMLKCEGLLGSMLNAGTAQKITDAVFSYSFKECGAATCTAS